MPTHVYTKLRAWELTQHAAVLYLDLDTLVVGQVIALFEVHLPQMRARGQTLGMGRITHPDGLDYNPGVILLVPYLGLFAALVQSINSVKAVAVKAVALNLITTVGFASLSSL
jgi:hypothetical protein